MAKLIAKTYGDALYETAMEKQTLDQLADETAFARDSFAQNPDFMRLLTHPQIDKDQKIACVKEVFGGRVSDDLVGLICVAVERDVPLSLPLTVSVNSLRTLSE